MGRQRTGIAFAGGLLVLAPLLMILFREKYPRWWFDWNVALLRFQNRVATFVLLLRDEYPSTDEEQAVHLEIAYPDVPTDLNRWLPLVKWFLAIPHYIVLIVLDIGVFFVVVFAWFAILFTGRYPRGRSTSPSASCAGTTASSARVPARHRPYPPFSLGSGGGSRLAGARR